MTNTSNRRKKIELHKIFKRNRNDEKSYYPVKKDKIINE